MRLNDLLKQALNKSPYPDFNTAWDLLSQGASPKVTNDKGMNFLTLYSFGWLQFECH